MSKFCSNCGNEMDENASYCGKCGAYNPLNADIANSGNVMQPPADVAPAVENITQSPESVPVPEAPDFTEATDTQKPKKRKWLKPVIISGSVLAVLVVLFVAARLVFPGVFQTSANKVPFTIMVNDISEPGNVTYEAYYTTLGSEPVHIATMQQTGNSAGIKLSTATSTYMLSNIKISPNSQIAYYISNGILFCKQPNSDTTEIGKAADFKISDDGKTVVYESEDVGLNIRYANGDTENITTSHSVDYEFTETKSVFGKAKYKVYFTDNSDFLYEWTPEKGSVEIDSDVTDITMFNYNACYYQKDESHDYNYFVKFSNSKYAESLGEVDDEMYMALSSGGYAVFYISDGDLCVRMKGNNSYTIAYDVEGFSLYENDNYLSYITSNNNSYIITLPDISKNTYKNFNKFCRELSENTIEPPENTIIVPVPSFQHLNVNACLSKGIFPAFNINREELAVVVMQKGKLLNIPLNISKDNVKDVTITDNYFAYVTTLDKLYVLDLDNLRRNEAPVLVADKVKGIIRKDFNQPAAFCVYGDNSLYTINEKCEVEILINDVSEYDSVCYENVDFSDVLLSSNSRIIIYQKKLSDNDINGYYTAINDNMFLRISSGYLSYCTGLGKYETLGKLSALDSKTMSLQSETESIYIYKYDSGAITMDIKSDGQDDLNDLPLTKLSHEEFNEKLAKMEAAEEPPEAEQPEDEATETEESTEDTNETV